MSKRLLPAVAAAIMLHGCGPQYHYLSDAQAYGCKGKVKSVTEKMYAQGIVHNGQWLPDTTTLVVTTTSYYDHQGMLTATRRDRYFTELYTYATEIVNERTLQRHGYRNHNTQPSTTMRRTWLNDKTRIDEEWDISTVDGPAAKTDTIIYDNQGRIAHHACKENKTVSGWNAIFKGDTVFYDRFYALAPQDEMDIDIMQYDTHGNVTQVMSVPARLRHHPDLVHRAIQFTTYTYQYYSQ